MLAAGRTSRALELYETELFRAETDLPDAMRAAVYIHRWLRDRSESDWHALRHLAGESAEGSPIDQAWRAVEPFARIEALAEAVRLGDTGGSVDLPEDAAPLERLALAVVTSIGAAGEESQEAVKSHAARVLALLPEAGAVPQSCRRVWAHLLVWAVWSLERPERICTGREALEALDVRTRRQVLTAAARAWARDALANDRFDEACQAAEALGAEFGSSDVRAHRLRWGLDALIERHVGDGLVQWFRDLVKECEEENDHDSLAVCQVALAVALLGKRRHAEALRILPVGERAPVGALVLRALGLLAETREWPADGDTSGIRPLWLRLRPRLEEAVRPLFSRGGKAAGWGHLLPGLMTYADRDEAVDPGRIDSFREGIDSVPGERARGRLHAIEGCLAGRLDLQNEVIRLVRARDAAGLRALRGRIEGPDSPGLPDRLRAAAGLVMWMDDPVGDLSETLDRLVEKDPEDELSREAVRQVRIAGTIRQLAAECRRETTASREVPSLRDLEEFDRAAFGYASMAAAFLSLRRSQPEMARRHLVMAVEDEETANAHASLRFLLAWHEGNVQGCRELIESGVQAPDSPSGRKGWPKVLAVREAVQLFEDGKPFPAWALISAASGGKWEPHRASEVMVSLTAWLLQRGKPQAAHFAIEIAHDRLLSGGGLGASAEREALSWTLLALEVFALAGSGQCTLAIESARKLLARPCPPFSGFGKQEENKTLRDWMEWTIVTGELALASRSPDTMGEEGRRVCGSLSSRAERLVVHGLLRPYLALIAGYLRSFSDSLGDQELAFQRLGLARRRLSFVRHAQTVEQAIERLSRQRRQLEDFWQTLASGDMARGRQLFEEQIRPQFGSELPVALKLALLLADWGSNRETLERLLVTLEDIALEAREEDQPVIERIRTALQQEQRIARIAGLIAGSRFEEVVPAVEHAAWMGGSRGEAIPAAAALALQVALARIGRERSAIHLGRMLTVQDHGERWMRETAAFLTGVLSIRRHDRVGAWEAFSRVGQPYVAGHNAGYYRAAVGYLYGVELLQEGDFAKGHEVVRASLGEAAGPREALARAPLLIHLGLRALEARDPRTSRLAFELLGGSLESAPESAAVAIMTLISRVGSMLCRHAEEEGEEAPEAGDFTGLLEQPGMEALDAEFRVLAAGALRRLALCYELRRMAPLDSKDLPGSEEMAEYLGGQVNAITEATTGRDPVLLALKGMAALRFGAEHVRPSGVASLKRALRLGVSSKRLAEAMAKAREELAQSSVFDPAALDLFDRFLSDGSIPADVRDRIQDRGDVAELYRLNRTYSPPEIAGEEVPSAVATIVARINHLLEYLDTSPLSQDTELIELGKHIRPLAKQLAQDEERLLQLEKTIMERLARRLRQQAERFTL